MDKKRIAVIGGGAAGLAFACAVKNAEVTVYERNDRVGKKLLQTGNGRCNLVNTQFSAQHLHSANMNAICSTLGSTAVSEITDFFEGMGLLMRTEDEGRVYPLCNQASAVLDVLRYTAVENGAELVCDFCVNRIEKKESGFEIISNDGRKAIADIAVLACGGMAAPKTGSDGIGYKLAKSLGHSVTKLSPVLVALKTDTAFTAPLKGIRCRAGIKLIKGRKVIAEETGEIQFTDYGISGIAAMQLSRHLSDGCAAVIDFAQLYDEEYILRRIKAAAGKGREVQDLLLGIVQKRVAQQIIKKTLNISPAAASDKLSEKDLARLSAAVKRTELPVLGTLKWDNAQVTAGGIDMSEIVPETMESKLCSGLYIVGEMLDCDGECGGYNLGWAWISALRAAEDIKG